MGIEKVGWEELVVESLQYKKSHHNFDLPPTISLSICPVAPGSPSSPAAIITPKGHIHPHPEATSVSQSSHSVLSDSLRPDGLQHTSFPVHHQLLELAQTHVHRVGDAIQSSHPLSSPSPPAFSLSQHQDLFQ